jgi:hypothetical protein
MINKINKRKMLYKTVSAIEIDNPIIERLEEHFEDDTPTLPGLIKESSGKSGK